MNSLTNRFKKMKNRKGFTLVELIVVIVIIGILAAILIPRMSGFTNKAKGAEAVVIAKQVATAYDSIYAEKGNYDDAYSTQVASLAAISTGAFSLNDNGGVSVTVNGQTASRATGTDEIALQ